MIENNLIFTSRNDSKLSFIKPNETVFEVFAKLSIMLIDF